MWGGGLEDGRGGLAHLCLVQSFETVHKLGQCHLIFSKTVTAQCADSEVRNAIERTPYVVVLKFHVFILISKSFNFRSPLDRILRYLTKT